MNNSYFVSPRFKGPPGQEDMPYLLTPGPVTTSRGVKIAMLSDYGAHDPEFLAMVGEVRRELKRLGGGDESYECVLLAGPANLAAEAALGSFTPAKRKKVLVVGNGASARQANAVLGALGRACVRMEKTDAEGIASTLDGDGDITHVWVTHCDADSGSIAPLENIGAAVKSRGKTLLVDAALSFAALPLDLVNDKIDVLVGGANACLESVPGLSFVLVKRDLLIASEGKGHSPTLDLHAEWKEQESGNHFRFTPPTHAVVALRQALRELEAEGGIGMRRARYQHNAEELITRMRAMGFNPLLPDTEAGPIVQCFRSPRDTKFVFSEFADNLRQRGFVIAPGVGGSFRIGTIGQINDKVIKELAKSVEAVLKHMDVQEFSPANT